jgi:parvulin-like peptidyl-prolyl isomerase
VKSKKFFSVSAVAAMVIAGAMLVSCSSVDSIDSVATVNGKELGRDEFEDLVAMLNEAEIFTLTNGELTSEDARQVLLTMISAEVVRGILADYDIEVTDADRETYRAQLQEGGQLEGYSDALKDYAINLYAEQGALSNIEALTDAEIEELYDSEPGAAGVMCLRHLVVEAEDTALEALAEYEGGTEFAEVAGKYSTEPNAVTSGGALRDTTNDNDCISVVQYQRQFDMDFVRGALTAEAGAVVGPIKSSFGYHLIESRSFDDVKESLSKIFESNTGASLADAALLNSDVRVDSSFGKWDASSGVIVDL